MNEDPKERDKRIEAQMSRDGYKFLFWLVLVLFVLYVIGEYRGCNFVE